MKQRVNQYDFEEAFRDSGRFGGDNDNFSYEALQLLFEYFEELEEDCETEIELDVIAICCDYCEMSKSELVSNYEIELHSLNNSEEDDDEIADYLNTNTCYVGKTIPLFPTSSQSINTTTYVFQSF